MNSSAAGPVKHTLAQRLSQKAVCVAFGEAVWMQTSLLVGDSSLPGGQHVVEGVPADARSEGTN